MTPPSLPSPPEKTIETFHSSYYSSFPLWPSSTHSLQLPMLRASQPSSHAITSSLPDLTLISSTRSVHSSHSCCSCSAVLPYPAWTFFLPLPLRFWCSHWTTAVFSSSISGIYRKKPIPPTLSLTPWGGTLLRNSASSYTPEWVEGSQTSSREYAPGALSHGGGAASKGCTGFPQPKGMEKWLGKACTR